MFRYMLNETKDAKIIINKEIQLIEDYIDLEKIRYNDRLNIVFNKSIDDQNTMIAPLILLPFVENAFKHGASEARFNTNISINLEVQKKQLAFTITNTKENTSNTIIENIGLANVKRQLELTYKKYDLKLANNENEFCVTLQIDLNHE
jgi:two-component system, LytTR family, sensor kinase